MDDLHNELNSLLTYLHEFNVVELVQEHYDRFNNPAPASLLATQIEKLQDMLDEVKP